MRGELPPSFVLRLARKDLRLALDAADLELPALRGALQDFDRALELGLGDLDPAAVVRAVAPG